MVRTEKVNTVRAAVRGQAAVYGRSVICGFALAVLLCGCGRQADGLVLIGESVPAQTRGAAGQASDQAGQASGTAGQAPGAAEQASGESGQTQGAAGEALIYVYVCGAVNSPGVVALPEGSRVEAALAAAGGLRPDAGTDYVNLAAKVKDGEKLYFPTAEELEKMAAPGEAQEGSGTDGRVNINTADLAALCTLSGIGESRARDILSYREANGPFASCEDIMKVPGIKESVYGKIKDKIKIE